MQNQELRSTLSPLINGVVNDLDTTRQEIENWVQLGDAASQRPL